MVESKDEIIQRTDPIFLDPPRDSFLRAHFYAPRKALFGRYFETYWVNICVIWFMTITLVIALYFDWLKKLLDAGENLIGKIGKKQQE
jgi:hypothetical protein